MLCILTALKAESEPLINFFKLRKDSSFDFPVFSNNDITLLAIGVGKKNISKRIITVYNQFKRFNLIFINIGIAGGSSKNSKIGKCYSINKIMDESERKTYYPEIFIKNPFNEKKIKTFKSVVKSINEDFDFLIDMESFEIFKVCSKLVPIHRIVFLKVVSDYVNENFENLNPNYISKLIFNNLDKFEIYLKSLVEYSKSSRNILNNDDVIWLKEINKVLSLTESQKTIIINRVKGFRLRKKDEKLPSFIKKTPNSKNNQKDILKKVNDQLSI
tara:strand:- start:423 stop:1241 length:819 start_codon:yes stop_codon:yes gene_type:complete